VRDQVKSRLEHEINRLIGESAVAAEKGTARRGRFRETQTTLMQKAAEIEGRLSDRFQLLDRQEQMSAKSAESRHFGPHPSGCFNRRKGRD